MPSFSNIKIIVFTLVSGVSFFGWILFSNSQSNMAENVGEIFNPIQNEFVQQCLDWKLKAGFEPTHPSSVTGCQCIAENLSKIAQEDYDVAHEYLKISIQFPGRTRQGLQDYFLDQISRSKILENISEDQSTRAFNFLAQTMFTCNIAIAN